MVKIIQEIREYVQGGRGWFDYYFSQKKKQKTTQYYRIWLHFIKLKVSIQTEQQQQ